MPTLDARPEPIEVDFEKSAIVVVDMQNAFASKGGMLDQAGVDIADAPRVVQAIRAVLEAARAAEFIVTGIGHGTHEPCLE
jgi:ureidoacrylate peracid hydrolase